MPTYNSRGNWDNLKTSFCRQVISRTTPPMASSTPELKTYRFFSSTDESTSIEERHSWPLRSSSLSLKCPRRASKSPMRPSKASASFSLCGLNPGEIKSSKNQSPQIMSAVVPFSELNSLAEPVPNSSSLAPSSEERLVNMGGSGCEPP